MKNARKYLDHDALVALLKGGSTPDESTILLREVGAPILDAKADAGAPVPWVFSDASEDRHGDTVAVAGWRLDSYKKNNVILFAHNSWDLPIGKGENVRVEGNALRGDITFASKEYDFAANVEKLVRGGYLKAGSVGFRPIKYAFNEERNSSGWNTPVDFLEQELLEFSIVPIPANQNALAEAKSAGIEMAPYVKWAEKALDLAGVQRGGGEQLIEKALRELGGRKVFSFKLGAVELSAPSKEELKDMLVDDAFQAASRGLPVQAKDDGAKCAECSEPLPPAAKFCPACGEAVVAPSSEPVEEAVTPEQLRAAIRASLA